MKNLCQYPLSVTNYGDMSFDKPSEVFFNGEELLISDSISILENFNYEAENGKLIIYYSTYGIPLDIQDLTKTKLTLVGGGFGNSLEEQSRYFKIELKR